MPFPHLFRSTRAAWQRDAGGAVWRLLTRGALVVAEVRDVERRTASFLALDLPGGNVRWNVGELPGGWWIGMHGIVGETLLLHGFEKPDMPLPKGVTAIDCATGTTLWHDDARTLLFTSNGRAYVERASFQSHGYEEIDVRTGATRYDYGANDDGIRELRRVALDEPADPGARFSEPLDACSPAVRERVTAACDLRRARGTVEVLATGAVTVVGFHEPARANAERFAYHVRVVNDAGRTLYEDTPVAGAPSIVPDAYFVQNDVLLYVHEGRHIVGVPLAALTA